MGKLRFEQWLWDQAAAKVAHYYGNNGIFAAEDEEYCTDCNENGQTQSFLVLVLSIRMQRLNVLFKPLCA